MRKYIDIINEANAAISEDLDIKAIKDHEIVLDDPANDEVDALKADSPRKTKEVLDKVSAAIDEASSCKKFEKIASRALAEAAAKEKKTYYTLAVREDDVWAAQFGDYDRATVKAEMEDQRAHFKAKDLKIISSDDDQASINKAIAALN